MKNCAYYIALAKQVLGDPRMSDRQLGESLGGQVYISQNISRAKSGYMLDALAMDLGRLLKKHGAVDHPGEVLMVARAERERDVELRATMLDYVGKVLASVPKKAAGAVGALAVALGLLLQPAHEARAAGGDGRF